MERRDEENRREQSRGVWRVDKKKREEGKRDDMRRENESMERT